MYGFCSHICRCTNPRDWGCERTGSAENVLNPLNSARIRTVKSFSFTYGKLEVRAKLPAGDWIWPGTNISALLTYSFTRLRLCSFCMELCRFMVFKYNKLLLLGQIT